MMKSAVAVSGMMLCCAWFSSSLEAQTFVLDDDVTIEGTITRATNNTILVMEETGAIVPLSLADISEIQITASQNGELLSGELVGWDNGVYEIRTQKYMMRIADGRILSVTDTGVGVGGPISEQPAPAQRAAPSPSETEDANVEALDDGSRPSPASQPIKRPTM